MDQRQHAPGARGAAVVTELHQRGQHGLRLGQGAGLVGDAPHQLERQLTEPDQALEPAVAEVSGRFEGRREQDSGVLEPRERHQRLAELRDELETDRVAGLEELDGPAEEACGRRHVATRSSARMPAFESFAAARRARSRPWLVERAELAAVAEACSRW